MCSHYEVRLNISKRIRCEGKTQIHRVADSADSLSHESACSPIRLKIGMCCTELAVLCLLPLLIILHTSNYNFQVLTENANEK